MLPRFKAALKAQSGDPRGTIKIVLGVLLGLNLIAAYFYFFPPGGSAAELETALVQTRTQLQRGRATLDQAKASVKKVQTARQEQEKFVNGYFMDRRTASSTILTEIGVMAKQAGITPREHSFTIDPVEGSDEFSMMTITANYEGNYGDLVQFVNAVDRSQRFLIIDSIAAQPQQTGGLQARFKMNAFLREAGPGTVVPEVAVPEAAPTNEATPPVAGTPAAAPVMASTGARP